MASPVERTISAELDGFIVGSLTLSVVMVVRNMANTIDQAIRSVLTQDYRPLELLVLDAGSTDGTVDVIKNYESEIAYWRSFPDNGPIAATNEGIQRSRGDVICFLAADDWFERGSISRVMDVIRANPDAEIVTCGSRCVRVLGNGGVSVQRLYVRETDLDLSPRMVVWRRLGNSHWFRRSVFSRIGKFDENYRLTADFELLLRAYLDGVKTATCPALVYTYRWHPQSATTGRKTPDVLRMVAENRSISERYLVGVEPASPLAVELKALFAVATLSLAVRNFIRGQIGEAWSAVKHGMRVDPWWLFRAVWRRFIHLLPTGPY